MACYGPLGVAGWDVLEGWPGVVVAWLAVGSMYDLGARRPS